ncbi:MAG: D-threo-aldose 1-dehydrogenase, partial [Frankiales bacterium]|nr:D-threo-aldose 1-dehydrogenase [Frankiales bacterium]
MVELPRLGYGAAALGNLYAPMDDETARGTVDAAWAAGIRHFDVAPHYGLGLAERRLGQALADRARNEYVLSTKVGRLLQPSPETAGEIDDMGFVVPADQRRVWDTSEGGLRRSLDESLERMGLGRVDVLYLHDPELAVPAGGTVASVLEEALPALARMRDEGLVSAVGVGSASIEAQLGAVRSGLVDVIMLAGRYTLLEQPALAELLPECLAGGVRVVAVGVYNSGAMSEVTPRPDLPYEYGAMPPEVFERLTRLAAVCGRHGTDLPTAALHFPLRHPAVTSVAVGAGSPE